MFPDGENFASAFPFINPYSHTVFTLSAYHAEPGTSENPVYSTCFLKFDRPASFASAGIPSANSKAMTRSRLSTLFMSHILLVLKYMGLFSTIAHSPDTVNL